MNDFNLLFRQRIGLSMDQAITFDDLEDILDRTSQALPFENMAIMLQKNVPLNKENLIDKILNRHEGGLCYELNPLLYLFLLENRFEVSMYYGRVYNGTEYGDKTHVMFLVKHKEENHLIDTGFGGRLPLKPVPMTGETIHSKNGSFRIAEKEGEHILEMNLVAGQEGWEPGYKFYIHDPISRVEELGTVQDTIINSDTSPFNKEPLLTSFTEGGRHTLTKNSYIVWTGRVSKKTEIEPDQFYGYAQTHFNLKF